MTKKQKNNVVWMFSISILAFLVLLSSLFYFYKNEDAEQIAFLKNEKSTLISELKLKIIAYDSVISVNNDLKQELLDEKATVQILIEKLETLHADVSDLKGLRNEFYKLKRQVKNKSQVTSVPVATQVVSNVKKEQAIAKAESAIAVTEKPVVIDPDLKMTDFKIRVYSEKKSGSLGNGGSKRNVDVLFVN